MKTFLISDEYVLTTDHSAYIFIICIYMYINKYIYIYMYAVYTVHKLSRAKCPLKVCAMR